MMKSYLVSVLVSGLASAVLCDEMEMFGDRMDEILASNAKFYQHIADMNAVSCPSNPTSCTSFPSLSSIYDGSNGALTAYNLTSNVLIGEFLTLAASTSPAIVGCSSCVSNNCVTGCVSATYHATTSVSTGTSSFWSSKSNGIPNHYASLEGVSFEGSWYDELEELGKSDHNPNAIMSQSHFVCIPKTPYVPADGYWGTYADSNPIYTPMGKIGMSVNGIPIFNEWADPTGTSDAMDQEQFDDCKGHPEGSGKYHYHQVNACVFGTSSPSYMVSSTVSKTSAPTSYASWLQDMIDTNNADGVVLVGASFDGFPIYGPLGFDLLTGHVRIMTSSYVSQTYVNGAGNLDDCNGIDGVTSEYPESVYHYHTTIKAIDESGLKVYVDQDGNVESEFPYAIAKYHGVPQTCNFDTMSGPPTPPSK